MAWLWSIRFNWLLIGVAFFYTNATIIKKKYKPDQEAFKLHNDVPTYVEGIRLAKIHGCADCHGPEMQGSEVMKVPFVFTAIASNLTQVVKTWSDAELERSIRQGIRRNGTTPFLCLHSCIIIYQIRIYRPL